MRTTINIDDEILEKASRLTGIKEKTALVRIGLETLLLVKAVNILQSLVEQKRIFALFHEEDQQNRNNGYC